MTESAGDLHNSKILIIDDEESIRLTFERFLQRAGYENVFTVSSFSEALIALEQQEFDLVISDIVLGKFRGTDLLRNMREQGIDCPVIMITGYPNLESASEAVRLGAFDYIPKPINKEALLSFSRQALQHSFLQKEKKHLKQENEKFQQYLEAIFRSVRDAIIAVDTNLNIIQINDTAKSWIEDEVGSVGFEQGLEKHSGAIIKSFLDDARLVLKSKKEVREHRFEYTRKDGSSRLISLNAAPIKDSNDIFQGVVLTGRNITLSSPFVENNQRISFHGFIGSSDAMQEVYQLVESVGKTDATVLVTGESGTGKELTAEALHKQSNRSDKQLVKVNCASIADDILESELFGHVKGSFTGAHKDRNGLILQAENGTLFLDEIGDISRRMQLRLLRFLQERTFYPVGQDSPISVDVRIITATNADLKQKVEEGLFREDLFYRLRVVEVSLPPLRARKEEIPLLTKHFLHLNQQRFGVDVTGISDQVLEALMNYSWPGNVRELKHVIERACVLCGSETIKVKHLPGEIGNFKTDLAAAIGNEPKTTPLTDMIKKEQQEASSQEIAKALRSARGNKAKAARILGINRTTLYRRMNRLGMN